ncbi:YciK family oxidoreductase [Saccharobesus litoralis]|uniref:YciK family oxidoreductase n=1 Tax=Saccharobesus litoralis TaxID=2172099 RepID=A0A2S0VLA5_9ALTE|nr:YciK family oxidoreductase [Saccharobesus litoralis]AWB64988.1 YciK family oxidoreductase [Saccharobesus litoralis]
MQDIVNETNCLEGKVILVTGAGAGIGKAAAFAYAQHGAEVILLGKTTKKLEQTYDEIEKAGYKQPAIIPLDLKGATEQNYIDMANTIISQFGRLDGLLHNASALGGIMPIDQYPLDMWNEVMQVNVTSQFMMTKALIPALKLAEKPSVIFTSSSVGRKGRAYWGAYSVSKFATEGMMQVFADEFEFHPIKFNSINPGATATRMRAKAYPAEDPNTLKQPADLMPLYVQLMSDVYTKTTQALDAQPK